MSFIIYLLGIISSVSLADLLSSSLFPVAIFIIVILKMGIISTLKDASHLRERLFKLENGNGLRPTYSILEMRDIIHRCNTAKEIIIASEVFTEDLARYPLNHQKDLNIRLRNRIKEIREVNNKRIEELRRKGNREGPEV